MGVSKERVGKYGSFRSVREVLAVLIVWQSWNVPLFCFQVLPAGLAPPTALTELHHLLEAYISSVVFKTASSLFLFGLWLCSEFRPLFTVHMVYVVQASSSHTHCTVWVWLLCGPPERAGRGGSSTSRTLKENHNPDQSHSCACSKVRLRSCEPKISQYLKWNDQSTLFVCCLLASKLRGIA